MRRPLEIEDNKYSRGVVVVAAGTATYPGAALLAVGGARRGNAGYVKFLNSNKSIRDLVVAAFPDVVPISKMTGSRCDALLVGPGGAKISTLPKEIPVVLDSSAISLAKRARPGVTVVTPHEGELKYLGSRIRGNRLDTAKALAKDLGVFVVLKGHQSIIASPTGEVEIDQIGGPELATAGSGDLLAGLIASFLVSVKDGGSPFELICGAIKLHSLAGKNAAKKYTSVTAIEIMESLRDV